MWRSDSSIERDSMEICRVCEDHRAGTQSHFRSRAWTWPKRYGTRHRYIDQSESATQLLPLIIPAFRCPQAVHSPHQVPIRAQSYRVLVLPCNNRDRRPYLRLHGGNHLRAELATTCLVSQYSKHSVFATHPLSDIHHALVLMNGRVIVTSGL